MVDGADIVSDRIERFNSQMEAMEKKLADDVVRVKEEIEKLYENDEETKNQKLLEVEKNAQKVSDGLASSKEQYAKVEEDARTSVSSKCT